jgi:pyridoxine 5-phosphate synthase
VTSDHGWDLPRQHDVVAPIVARLKKQGIRTAIFVDPNPDMMKAAAATGVDRVEIYTEPYASAWGTGKLKDELARVKATAQAAVAHGMAVNCGHDLNLRNTPLLARDVPEIVEASIGHALLADALYLGLGETVRRYVRACRGEAVDAPVTQ